MTKPATLKLVMAVSKDHFFALGANDPMDWTGREDKKVFKLLTSVGGVLGAGRRTFQLLPELKGRKVVCLSTRKGWVPNAEAREVLDITKSGPSEMVSETAAYEATMSLGAFAFAHPGAWLIGGLAIAMEAFHIGLLDEVHLCRNEAILGPYIDPTDRPILDRLTPMLERDEKWRKTSVAFTGVTVESWRRGR